MVMTYRLRLSQVALLAVSVATLLTMMQPPQALGELAEIVSPDLLAEARRVDRARQSARISTSREFSTDSEAQLL